MKNNKKRTKRQVKNIYDVVTSHVFWIGLNVFTIVLSDNNESIIKILNAINRLLPSQIIFRMVDFTINLKL